MFQKLFNKVNNRKKPSKSVKYLKTDPIDSRHSSEDSVLKMKKDVKLPEEFAQQVIQLEIQCERSDATKEHANQLMDLYTIAIEHYNCKSDYENQVFFQSKLTTLLNRNDIQQLVDHGEQASLHPNGVALPNKEEKIKMREKQIEKKKFQDAMQLSIFNQEKKNEPEKEKALEDQIEQRQEAIKVVQKEQLQMTEQFRKRLAERKKKINNNRSMSASKSSLNMSLNAHFEGRKVSNVIEDQEAENNENEDQANFDEMIQYNQEKTDRKMTIPKKGIQKFASSNFFGAPQVQGSSLASGNDSFFNCGKSVNTNGGGLASKISLALSRVVWNRNNNMINDDDDEFADLLQLIEELNQHSDLTVKLNNQSKICKILETNDEIFFPNQNGQLAAAAQARANEKIGLDINVKGIMSQCKVELERLQSERETAIEEFLDKLAEEKIQAQQEIKMKYSRLINMLKNGKDPKKEEKVANNEDKKLQELDEILKEHIKKKNQGLTEIKEKFNTLSKQIKIDAIAISEALKKKAQISKPSAGAVESPIKKLEEQQTIKAEKDKIITQSEYGLDALQDYKQAHRESTGYIGSLRPQ